MVLIGLSVTVLQRIQQNWRELLTLIKTRFPERSTSVMESLLERDMIAIGDLPADIESFSQVREI